MKKFKLQTFNLQSSFQAPDPPLAPLPHYNSQGGHREATKVNSMKNISTILNWKIFIQQLFAFSRKLEEKRSTKLALKSGFRRSPKSPTPNCNLQGGQWVRKINDCQFFSPYYRLIFCTLWFILMVMCKES